MMRLVLAWAGLVAAVLASLGLAYLPLGSGNMAVALVIAIIMATTLVVMCMRLGSAPPLARLFAIGGIAWLLILLALGNADYRTRTVPSIGLPARQSTGQDR